MLLNKKRGEWSRRVEKTLSMDKRRERALRQNIKE
jgi:hypothetical protein